MWTDDGFVGRFPETDEPPDPRLMVPASEEVEALVLNQLGGTAMFAAKFREAAGRALLLPKRRPGGRSPLWQLRKRSADLLAVASRFGSFPIVLETYRECLRDVFDMPALVETLGKMERREIRVATVDSTVASPFAAALLFGYVANYLYDGDAPLAERRAQALSVDQAQLRELLGEAELRELLDPAALLELEASLQGRDEGRGARSADRVHDLLLRLGALSPAELALRVEPPGPATAAAFLAGLEAERRVVRVTIAGEERLAAAEDAGRLRDALGVVFPPGLPEAFLEHAPHALEDLFLRYARTHGPFRAADAAHRFGVGEVVALQTLRALAGSGRVVEGEFRPGGSGREWCGSEVLATLRRRSRARLRREAEPAEPAALSRLLLDWHGIGTRAPPRPGPDGLLDVIEQLQGATFPASALERDILPARLPDYRPEHLDMLCAAGEVLWVGVSPLGEHDGRIALYLADDLWLLHAPSPTPLPGELPARLRAHLARHGASFFAELQEALGGGLARPVQDALWDLVFAGEVTNDTPGALRAFLGSRPSRSADRLRRRSPFRSRRQAPPSAAGRWSLLVPPVGDKAASPTLRAATRAEQLVARHGVLTRDAVAADEPEGGFSAVYPVLRALEESGRVRRGYFVTGLGGSQFAHPGALDRLRALREDASADEEPSGVVLASTDPANPYGAALPWPKGDTARPMRAASTHVVVVDGRLAAYLGRGERELSTFLPADEPMRARIARGLCRALATWAMRTGRSALGWSTADGIPLALGPLASFLTAAGFVRSGPGFRFGGFPPDASPATDR
jgi:ATP-dependent Lhr-like helicase